MSYRIIKKKFKSKSGIWNKDRDSISYFSVYSFQWYMKCMFEFLKPIWQFFLIYKENFSGYEAIYKSRH